MSESDVIAVGGPFTRASITHNLHDLGVENGCTLLVHSSLSRIGWVAGGAHAVVLGLLDVLGPDGTLVMPTHTGGLGDPTRWQQPARAREMVADDSRRDTRVRSLLTPTRQMGAIVECIRHLPGVRRSDHPHLSFAAFGPGRDAIVKSHELAFGLVEGSPLARLYQCDARVLLLDVGHGNNTSIHLAEYRAEYPDKKCYTAYSPVLLEGERRWVASEGLDPDDVDFVSLGADFAATGQDVVGIVGAGTARLMGQRSVVDFADHLAR